MNGILSRMWESLPLLILALASALILVLADRWSAPRIGVQREHLLLQPVADLLPGGLVTDDLGPGRCLLARRVLGSDEPVRIHRLQQGSRWQGVLIEILSHDGYRGDILLGVVIDADGRLLGVRALVQQETRGLGDGVDYHVSSWMDQFSGRTLTPVTAWRLRGEGGAIDQLSGATVTSRAVVRAVYAALRLFHEYRDLFEAWPRPDCPKLSRDPAVCR